LVIPIPLSKETFQHLQVYANKKGFTVAEYLAKLIDDSIHFLQIQEKFKKDVEEWKIPRLIEAIPTDDYSLNVRFEGGAEGKYDLKPSILKGGVFSALSDIEFFRKISISENGDYITWPGEIDIGADSIYWDIDFWGDDKW